MVANVTFNSPSDCLSYYANGGIGWIDNQDTIDELLADNVVLYGATDDITVGDGDGKRVLLWQALDRPGFEPGWCGKEPQQGPDCTSKGVQRAIDTTRACEIILDGEPETYYRATASEVFYGARGSSQDGSDPALLTRFAVDYGFLARQNYPGVVDLTKYNYEIGNKWGRSGVPLAVKELCKEHKAGGWTMPKSPSEARSLMLRGRGGHSGQTLGFRDSTDANGIFIPITRGKEAWGHDMPWAGYDDTKDFYPVSVFFIANNWGRWCPPPKKWPTDLYGPWPAGLIVCTEEIFEQKMIGSRSCFMFHGIKGYKSKLLTDLGGGWL